MLKLCLALNFALMVRSIIYVNLVLAMLPSYVLPFSPTHLFVNVHINMHTLICTVAGDKKSESAK